MNNLKTLIAAAAFAAATFGPSVASAADISKPATALNVINGSSGFFGDAFTGNNGDTYTEKFTFNVTGLPAYFDAIVGSAANTVDGGLNLTGLSVYTIGGTLVSMGSGTSGLNDSYTVSTDPLSAGSYYLQVTGTLLSNRGASFGGSVSLTPVPEPETYAMMLAGLGLVGFAARRRKAAKQA